MIRLVVLSKVPILSHADIWFDSVGGELGEIIRRIFQN